MKGRIKNHRGAPERREREGEEKLGVWFTL